LAGDGAVTVWRGPGVDVGRRGSLGGRGRGAGGQDAGGDTGYAGCGVCWGMLSSGPAARSDTAGWSAGWSEPTLARTRDNVGQRRSMRFRAHARRQRSMRFREAGGRLPPAGLVGGGLKGGRQRPYLRATHGVCLWADLRASGGWRMEALTAMLACAAGRRDATPLCLSKGLLGRG
jgi:hypothetical protein